MNPCKCETNVLDIPLPFLNCIHCFKMHSYTCMISFQHYNGKLIHICSKCFTTMEKKLKPVYYNDNDEKIYIPPIITNIRIKRKY